MLYSINEIFYSIQGEGFHSGKPAVFIRMAGCNLECPWCDTDYSEKIKLDEWEIVKRLREAHEESIYEEPYYVVITGGEPTLQDLRLLLCTIKESFDDNYIAIETNGTNFKYLEFWKRNDWVDWITVSPKEKSNTLDRTLTIADEIKVVFTRDNLSNYISKIQLNFDPYDDGRLFIQPYSEDYQPAVDYVLKHPEWRLSIQIQKIINLK